jgi:hypothetical protein
VECGGRNEPEGIGAAPILGFRPEAVSPPSVNSVGTEGHLFPHRPPVATCLPLSINKNRQTFSPNGFRNPTQRIQRDSRKGSCRWDKVRDEDLPFGKKKRAGPKTGPDWKLLSRW